MTGNFLVTADQTKVWKIDRKDRLNLLVNKENFPREVNFLNNVAASHDKKSLFATNMAVISKCPIQTKTHPLSTLDSKQAKEVPATDCIYRIDLNGRVTEVVSPGQITLHGLNSVGITKQKALLLGDFFIDKIVHKTAKSNFRSSIISYVSPTRSTPEARV